MRKFYLVFMVMLALLCGCQAKNALLVAGSAPGNPATIDAYTWDFGLIRQGEIAKHTFTLKNESAGTLNIKDVNTSCGCTVTEIKKRILLPKEATLLEVQFNSKSYLGAIEQFVYMNTDNLDKPLIRFIIKAEVVK